MFIQSRVARDYALGTTDGEENWLLPINPLSFILIGMRAQTAAANLADSLLTLAAQLTSVQVRYRGTSIVSVSGADLLRLNKAMGIHTTQLWNPAVANDSVRSCGLVVPFGRRLFGADEAFPSSQKGETELVIQFDAVTASYDVITLNISTFELPAAAPKQFLRFTTMGDTPSATGDKDYDLPRIAPLAGIGLYQTNAYPDDSTPTVTGCKVLVNNQDYGYTDIDPVSMRELIAVNMPRSTSDHSWTQQENSGGAYVQNAESIVNHTLDAPERDFMYFDYDPLRDGAHLIPGPASSEVKMRVTFGTAEAIRIIPVEMYTPAMLPGRK